MIFSGWIAKIGAGLAVAFGILALILKGQRDLAKEKTKSFKYEVKAKGEAKRRKQRERTDTARKEVEQEAEQAQEQLDEEHEAIDAGERPTGNFGDPRMHDD